MESDPDRLNAIQQRADAATKGPWLERPRPHDDWGIIIGGDGATVCDAAPPSRWLKKDCGNPEGPSPIPENRAFIAHAREDVPWLCARVRELEASQRDADILLGVEWQASVRAVNGDPEAARQHRIAALVADLDEANDRVRALEAAVAEAARVERELRDYKAAAEEEANVVDESQERIVKLINENESLKRQLRERIG